MPAVGSQKECKIKISFIDRLDVVPLPRGFVLPQFTQFGGSGDPIKYLQDRYQQTADSFIAKFGSAIHAHQNETALMDIEQGPNESLRSYQKRYNDILLTITEVNNKIACMSFYRGLMYGKLKKALVLETPLFKDQLTARVKQYVELEELKTKEVRMRSAPGRQDKDRYCDIHREHRHDTNECRILKSEIEKLIKRGHLKEFIDQENPQDVPRQNCRSPPRANHPRIKNEPQEAPLITGRIDTIAGDKARGGDSRNSRKSYARREVYSINETTGMRNEIISFSDKELVVLSYHIMIRW
ncbi:hypothetical protein LIER_32265 [Lithospermum erythrorhizon]|uniref:Retrotransposon gag domain-containing protein n=1 Tax=Lithospermum erythrorhizon TaxID=34254 RepID=A0AAV3RX90_LITER